MLLCSFFSTALEIDDLTYTYAPDSNLLLKVTDATAHAGGFHDDSPDGTLASDPSDDYAYDAMGNMVKDENKSIQTITYNHLNLPTFIDFGTRGTISYLYDATGRKVRKVVRDNVLSNNKVTDYANGFQYLDNVIQHFPTAEGYASRLNLRQENGVVALLPSTELPVDFFTYVYNYTDHLGNIRLSYAQDPDTQQLKIVEQNHYYPFGLRHTNYSGGKMQVVKEQELKRMAPTPEELLSYKYKYNGKEWQDELGLNMYDYGARNYDPALGRWMNIDPKAETSRRWNPYTYCYNNPLLFVDPDGMQADIITPKFIDEKGAAAGSTQAAYVNEVQKATGNTYSVTFDKGGSVVFTQTSTASVTPEQQAFINEFSTVVNSPIVVNQEIVSNDAKTTVGSFQNNTMDMADVAQFDKAGPGAASTAGVIIHETVEQFEKAKLGIPQGSMGTSTVDAAGNTIYPQYDSSHATAIKAEDNVNGNQRSATSNPYIDNFTEKSGKVTRQAVVSSNTSGTVNVLKQ
ncbi:RHS repeat domain-containing protein [Flavobacterium sp.]|uniref:RHS repeat domain-containing protein n=1 Tax=Flavobacterium sp. TaxID=239 RepID=UPI00391B6B27